MDEIQFKLVESSVKRLHVSDEDYFGNEWKEWVSNSSLKYINPDEGGSAYSFRNRVTQEGDALELGNAIHKMILEGDKYFLSEVEKPNGKLGVLIDKAYEIAKINGLPSPAPFSRFIEEAAEATAYYSGALTENRLLEACNNGWDYFCFLIERGIRKDIIVLTPALKARLQKSVASIQGNKRVVELIKPSDSIFNVKHFTEDVVIAECIIDGTSIKLKAKIDSWSIDFDNKVITLNDLKSTSSSIQGFMGRHVTVFEPGTDDEVVSSKRFEQGSFQKWHYHRQMGMYAMLLKQCCVNEFNITDIDEWQFECNMIVAETVAPYNAYPFKVHDAWLSAGEQEMKHLLSLVVWHTNNGWDKVKELI